MGETLFRDSLSRAAAETKQSFVKVQGADRFRWYGLERIHRPTLFVTDRHAQQRPYAEETAIIWETPYRVGRLLHLMGRS